ncbi:MAG: hypothetical protein KAQ64_00055 [Candidatus Pacebacteria bacterium]|nr:hypothetical protein [Candidatus Paceibacterota bacterium]
MESHTKILLGYLMPVIAGLTYFYIKEEGIMLLIFGLSVLIGFPFVAAGMVGLIDEGRKAVAGLRNGDYRIMSTPVMKMRKGIGSSIHHKGVNEFNLQDAMSVISVQLQLVSNCYNEPMNFYEISAGKIPARFWQIMMTPGSVMVMEDGFVKNIYKPGE